MKIYGGAGSKNHQKGFTIIELMIATTVFSTVLLVAGTGIISIGRMYYKNINTTRTQEAARSVMEDVTRSLQFSEGIISNPETAGNVDVRCFGEDRYTYIINDRSYGLKIDNIPDTGCSLGDAASGTDVQSDARQLLGSGMRLMQFDVSPGVDENFKVNIKVAFGDDDLLSIYNNDGEPQWVGSAVPSDDAAGTECKSGPGSTFCSVAGLETSVSIRIE